MKVIDGYEEMDIYNCITAVLYNYLNADGYSIQSNFSYYAHEIIQSYEYMEDTSFIDPFDRLNRIMKL